MIRTFITVMREYRIHPMMYRLRTAWRIAVQGQPF